MTTTATMRGRTRTNLTEDLLDTQDRRYPSESPLWWVARLYKQLNERNEALKVFDDYYNGDFPLPWLAPQAAEEFRRIMQMSRANYCGLIVDSMVERMAIEGFRIETAKEQRDREEAASKPPKTPPGAAFYDPNMIAGVTKSQQFVGTSIGKADRETWRIWQANKMDMYFDMCLLEAAINGMAYIMIAPNDDDPKTPKMWIEHPTQCIVEFEPGSQRQKVAAGLKVWSDDIRRTICATLYLPGVIHKFEVDKPKNGLPMADRPNWRPRLKDDEAWPAKTGLDYVPIWEIGNNPRLLTGGRSELIDVLDTQDRIVKTIADRLVTQDYGAFPQRWARAWPEYDDKGRPTPKIDVGRDRMITTDSVDAMFGQFDAADLKGYMLGKKEDVHDMAARTRTPAQYLLGEFSNVNGETLKASESGLVAKCRQRMRGVDDIVEVVIIKLRELAGLSEAKENVTVEVVWRNPEFKTEGEQVDALQKMSTLGVPEQALWERWGASPPEIARWLEMQRLRAEQAMQNDAMMLLGNAYRQSTGGGNSVQDAPIDMKSTPTRGDGGRLTGRTSLGPLDGIGAKDDDQRSTPKRRPPKP